MKLVLPVQIRTPLEFEYAKISLNQNFTLRVHPKTGAFFIESEEEFMHPRLERSGEPVAPDESPSEAK